jgi:Family of unknown function (DUF6289)
MRIALRRSTFAFIAAVLVTVGSSTAPVRAMPNQAVYIAYFSDASHSDLVGEYWNDCTGEQYRWGTRTAYSVSNSLPCGGGEGCTPFLHCP